MHTKHTVPGLLAQGEEKKVTHAAFRLIQSDTRFLRRIYHPLEIAKFQTLQESDQPQFLASRFVT
jgi:phosphopantetheinyl transferase (holo-ACP synthase)